MIPKEKFQKVVQRLDPRNSLLEVSRLKGGVSASVSLLKVRSADGREKRMIVRLFGQGDGSARVASNEFQLLSALQPSSIPTHIPLGIDKTGEILPSPYILLDYMDGEVERHPASLPDFLSQMAIHLFQVHRVDHEKLGLSFLPRLRELSATKIAARPESLDESLEEGRIRDALEKVWPLPVRNEQCLLHGDYWPGNLLWRNGNLVGIIDWEEAALGDPVADLADARLELMMLSFGADAIEELTGRYCEMAGIDVSDLAYWDLYAALKPASKIAGWAEDKAEEDAMRRGHRAFVRQAFQRLEGLSS